MRRRILLLLLAVAAVGASPAPSTAATPPPAFIQAWSWGTFREAYAKAYSLGYTNGAIAWQANCNASAFDTPRLFPCWYSGTFQAPSGATYPFGSGGTTTVKNTTGSQIPADPDGAYTPSLPGQREWGTRFLWLPDSTWPHDVWVKGKWQATTTSAVGGYWRCIAGNCTSQGDPDYIP